MSKVTAPFLRSPFNYDPNQASRESGLQCDPVSLAKQSFAEECDINTIVRRFGITGELPSGVRMPSYGDFSDALDYHASMNAIKAADASFMALPADVRARFDNDPGLFVDFCSDPANLDEAISLGLAPQKPVQATPLGSGEGTPST